MNPPQRPLCPDRPPRDPRHGRQRLAGRPAPGARTTVRFPPALSAELLSAALLSALLTLGGCAAPGEGAPRQPAEPPGAVTAPEGAEAAPDSAVRREVLETVRTLFRGMALKDSDLLRSALLPDAIVRPVADLEGSQESMSGEAFIEQVMASPDELLERMFDPVIRVDGPLAHVWTPYDFWRNGEFSHCGTDSFDLIRTPDGWRISSVTYTLHPEELCAERPPPSGAS